MSTSGIKVRCSSVPHGGILGQGQCFDSEFLWKVEARDSGGDVYTKALVLRSTVGFPLVIIGRNGK